MLAGVPRATGELSLHDSVYWKMYFKTISFFYYTCILRFIFWPRVELAGLPRANW